VLPVIYKFLTPITPPNSSYSMLPPVIGFESAFVAGSQLL